ncbi:MAG: PSD1 and planctomycete cytochrome C domain-containing protein [Planctomycetota bacterium]|nr:PSD1 and planctomycete cytochrome C domain-containing protein [Planctomycetota bacterium]
MLSRIIVFGFTLVSLNVALKASDTIAPTPEKVAFFESKIRPLLLANCVKCHGEKSAKGGLRLDSKPGWLKGGDTGEVILPGNPDESLLIKAVRFADKTLQMPPKKKLADHEIALLTDWVRQGAIDPRSKEVTAHHGTSDAWEEIFKKRLDWWSLKRLHDPQPPKVADPAWSQNPVDKFIRAALDSAGIDSAPTAQPELLLRRLALVLTGLPPTPALRKDFLGQWQTSPSQAYENLVDRLLASPHFGERFARHWMDAVRYTDTYGYEWDNPAKGSHEYRDYLIRAFNSDIGFDQFLLEQLAGDLLEKPRINQATGTNESLIGTMFYHLGEHRHGSSLDFNGIHQDMINNKVDAFSKVFLATTVACARCHDHKLEAVSQRDYYALGAVFMTPRWTSRSIDTPEKNALVITALKELRARIRSEMAGMWRSFKPAKELWKLVLEQKNAPAPTIEQITWPLARLTKAEGGIEASWNALVSEWKNARQARIEANKRFKVLTDFQKPDIPKGWVTDGAGMAHGWVPEGTPLVALEGNSAIARLLPRGYHTNALSSKLPGALRMPPEHTVPGQFASLKLAGGEYGGYLTSEANAFQGEGVVFLKEIQPQWRSFADRPLKNGVTRVTVEFATADLNPNFPPRTGLAGGLPNNDLGYDKRSWLSITGIVTHDAAGAPQDTLESFASLYDTRTPAPKTHDEAQQRIAAWLSGAVLRWCDQKLQPGDLQILDWLLSHNLLPNQTNSAHPLAKLVAEYRSIEQGIAFPRSANGMDERQMARLSLHFNSRGDVDSLGELVDPDFLEIFEGRNDVANSPGSGRLELAESLLEPNHPLTSRVYVNRVWGWIFGTGLVSTPDNFGRLGDKPSHPELLDWLAHDFPRQGWSTKRLVRELVMSQTFRESGLATPQALERDPSNRLRHHYPTRRMEAESIRDSMLAVSGRLDPTLYGRPINPPRAVEDGSKRLFSGPVDGNGRRSLYLTMSIMAPPAFLSTFDLPDLKQPSGRRNATNVPTQALVMLNDPLSNQLAQHWATRLTKDLQTTPEDRIQGMFIDAFGREPQAAELKRWAAAVRSFATTGEIMQDQAAWAQLAHTLFNTQEFIHYR